MARVTVEDCDEVEPNRFKLVLMAAERAKAISAGSPPTVPTDNDKNPVVSLREIASKTVSADLIKEMQVRRYQKVINTDPAASEDELSVSEKIAEVSDELDSFGSQGLIDEDEYREVLFEDDDVEIEE